MINEHCQDKHLLHTNPTRAHHSYRLTRWVDLTPWCCPRQEEWPLWGGGWRDLYATCMLPVCNVLHVPFPWQVSPKQLNAEKPTTLETLQAWTSIEPDSARHGLGWSILLQSKPVQKVEREAFQYFLVTLPSLVMDSQQNVCGCIANSKIMQTAATWIWYVYIYISCTEH